MPDKKETVKISWGYALLLAVILAAVAGFVCWEYGQETGYEAGYAEMQAKLQDIRETSYDQGYDDGYAARDLEEHYTIEEQSETASPQKIEFSETPDSWNHTQTVYITSTGEKYHQSWCQYLRKSKIAISLDDAIDSGYTACSRCW